MRIAGSVLFVLGLLALTWGQWLFWIHQPEYYPPPSFTNDPSLPKALALFFGGALSMLIGCCFFRFPALATGEPPPGRAGGLHYFALLLILAAAFGMRSWRITSMPPPLFDDEANTALDAMLYLKGHFTSLIGTGWGEVPVLYTAMNSIALDWFGPTVFGARATGLVFSTLTVLMLYFTARVLVGPSLSLAVAAVFAAQFWHVTMSRWGASEVALPFFVCLAFLFTGKGFQLVLGAETTFQREGTLPESAGTAPDRDDPDSNPPVDEPVRMPWWRTISRWPVWSVALGGAALGLSLYIYLASRVVAAGVCAFLAYVVLFACGQCVAQRRLLWKHVLSRAALCLLYGICFLVVYRPMARYYADHPGIFTNRWKDISLPARMGLRVDMAQLAQRAAGDTGPASSPQRSKVVCTFRLAAEVTRELVRCVQAGEVNWKPLWDNVFSYLLMLHYSSNEISRHGVPFRPLLNPISGVLFAVGFVLLLRHVWRPANVFCLFWFCVPMLGGAITVSETPSPYRTIAAAPAVAIITLLPLYVLYLFLIRLPRWHQSPALRGSFWGAVLLLVLSGAVWDQVRYWRVLRARPELQRHFNYQEYAVAERVHRIPEQQPVFLQDHYASFSSVRLINWGRSNIRFFVPSEHVPVVMAEDTDVSILTSEPVGLQLERVLRHFYPNTVVEHATHSTMPGLGYRLCTIPQDDLTATRGVWRERAGQEPVRTNAWIAPGPQVEDVTFSADLHAPVREDLVGVAVSAQFAVRSNVPLGDRCTLVVSGQPLSSTRDIIRLRPGRTSLLLVLASAQPGETLELLWSLDGRPWEAVPAARLYAFPYLDRHGLYGSYYLGTEPTGTPLFRRVDLALAAPSAATIDSPHAVRWTGFLSVLEDGQYGFDLEADDRGRLFLDGALVIDKWGEYAPGSASVALHLTAGQHRIDVHYCDLGGGRALRLKWYPPRGEGGVTIPAEYLLHEPAPVVRVPFAGEL